MKRRVAIAAAIALVLAIAVLSVAHWRGGTRTGGTYDVTAEFVKGDDLCGDVHEVDAGGTKWFGQVVPPTGLPPDHSYEGTFYVVDQGAGGGRFGDPSNVGTARFTTGSTTVTFTRYRPCL